MTKIFITPHHIGIIMDGNGCCAQSRGQSRIAEHQAGVQATGRIVKASIELHIRVLTLYLFSTENWQRPTGKVSFPMHLVEEYVPTEALELHRNGVCLQFMGRRQKLPPTLLGNLNEITTQTQRNNRLILNLAINSGERAKIVDAARLVIQAHHQGEINIEELNPVNFARFLYCPGIPGVDLIIRTGGEHRLSHFLLWRSCRSSFLEYAYTITEF